VPDTMASQRVLEKAGCRREGHLRSYLVFDEQRADALIYSLLPSDDSPAMAEPRLTFVWSDAVAEEAAAIFVAHARRIRDRLPHVEI
jgi:hypothetical protein